MKFCLATLIFFLSIFFANNAQTFAQSDVTQSSTRAGGERYQDLSFPKRKRLVDTISQELKNGTLVVRLFSFESKINHLRKIGKTDEANQEQEKVSAWNKFLIAQFKKYYDFSDVVFTYGKDYKNFFNNPEKAIFVDEELNIDPSIVLNDGEIFVLAAQGTDTFYLYDKNMNRIPEPAPHGIEYFKKGNYNSGIFDSSDRFFEFVAGSPSNDTDVYYFNYKLHKIDRKFNGFRR